jgi:KDO2-lipid IV(A) lauroyltransferase
MEQYSPKPGPLRVDRPEPDAVKLALGEGRGVVVLTGHLGSWNIAAKALLDFGAPVNVVKASEANATSRSFVLSELESAGVRVVLSNASVFSSLPLVGALRRNEVVAMQLDRPLGAGGVRMLPFLGAPAPFPSGPFVLARLARSPIVPVFVPRVARRHYRVVIGERIDVPHEARDPQRLLHAMGSAVRQLEDAVRRHPTQWFQFSPFWPEPEADAGAPPADRVALAGARANQEGGQRTSNSRVPPGLSFTPISTR